MSRVDGGRLVAKMLKKEGVKCIFTLCSLQVGPILIGCAEEGIQVIDVRHEQAAAHAADGWAKVTGQPGVAVVMGGPGVSGTMVAMANAFSSSSPMLLIAGRTAMSDWDRVPPQELDCALEFMRPITKWARRVFDTKRIPDYVSTAFRQAIGPKPGPVFLEIPRDVLYGEVEETEITLPAGYRTTAKAEGDSALIAEAADLLSRAEKPVIIAGSSVWWAQAAKELQDFVEKAEIPIFLNAMGRGAIPPEHRLFFSLTRRFALNQADVVLSVGAPFDFRLGYGRPPLFREDVQVIYVDFDPVDIGFNRPVDVGIYGHIQAILRQLAQEIVQRPRHSGRESWLEQLRAEEIKRRQADEPLLHSDAVPIHPLRLCREIRDFLNEDAIIIGDGGDIVTFGVRAFKIHHPGHWLDTGPMGCLGIGTGYAMAAKLAHPDKQVLLLSGDGSFGLNGMEFDTMARHNIPVVCVIGNDAGWGEVRHEYADRFGKVIGTNLAEARRYDKVVEALGGYGELVQRPEEIRPALERAFASGLPACINVLTDPSVAYGRRGTLA
jgi:acetolactate synthase-1/2/3 large subunit